MSSQQDFNLSCIESNGNSSMFVSINSSIQQLKYFIIKLRKYQEVLSDKIHQKYETFSHNQNQYLRKSDIQNQQIIFNQLYSKIESYDNIIRSHVSSRSNPQSRQPTEQSVKLLFQNQYNSIVLNQIQYFQYHKNDFSHHFQAFKQLLQSERKLDEQEQELNDEIISREKKTNELLQIYQKQLEGQERSLKQSEVDNKVLEKEIMSEYLYRNNVRIEFETAQEILNDHYQLDTMKSIAEFEPYSFKLSKKVDSQYHQLIKQINEMNDTFNTEENEKLLTQYLQRLEFNNKVLKEDSDKTQDLLNQLNTHHYNINQSQETSLLPIQSLYQKHNNPFYRQKQIKVIEQQFENFQNSITQFLTSLDKYKVNNSLLSDIEQAIQNNVGKKQTLNQLNSQISYLETKLNSSNLMNSESKEKNRKKAELEMQQCERKHQALIKLLEDKELRVKEIEDQIELERTKLKQAKERKKEQIKIRDLEPVDERREINIVSHKTFKTDSFNKSFQSFSNPKQSKKNTRPKRRRTKSKDKKK